MHVISKLTLQEFWDDHADAKDALLAWFREASKAQWKSFDDIKRRYPSADLLPGGFRVIFNIKGNEYRLVTKIYFNTGIIYIRFVGTHAQYDKINAEKI